MNDLIGLLTRDGSRAVPLEGVRVTGDILGRGARVKVAQRFRNGGAQAIEAVYRFPLPESAAVRGFSAIVDGRRVTGRVEEREKAFETYDDALARGDGAFLLDQERPNIFTLSVGSLPAGAEAVVEIEYAVLLDQQGRQIRFALPTTISPRYLPADASDEGGIPARELIHPEYATSVPYGLSVEIAVRDPSGVESVESASHHVKVVTNADALVVSFASETAAMDRDFVLTVTRRGRDEGRAWRYADTQGAWIQLDLSLDEVEGVGGARREVIFVLDCSGSMGGDSIEQAKRALEVCLRALETGCSFNVVRFGSNFQSLFPRPREYGERSLGEALGWLKAVDADLGGTEVLAPLAHVYQATVAQGASRGVVLLTDGEVGNEAEVMSLVRAHAASTRFFCVGIGAGPNDHLVRGLARAGGGTAAFIFPGERIEPRVLAIFRQAIGARVTGLRIDWPGKTEQSPIAPVLLPGDATSIFARVAGAAAPSSVVVSAEIDGRPIRWELPMNDAGTGGIPLPALWARARIRDLEESPQVGGRGSRQQRSKGDAWKQEVIALAKEFGLSSSLTSWIAVEEREEKDRQTGELVLRTVPTLLTIGWHGVGSVMGAQAAGGVMKKAVMRADVAMPMMMPAMSPAPLRSMLPSVELRARAPLEPDMDLLMALLSHQRVDGGFDLDDAMLGRLGIRPPDVAAAARSLPGDSKTVLRVLHTAIVLAVLEIRFPDARDTWFSAVRKSRTWLKQAAGRWGPVMAGTTVDRWAKEVAAAGGAATNE